jgi:Kef-type K+ transport system membrane component KefB
MVGVNGGLFLEIGFIVIVAACAAYILRFFRQPQILAYVLVGVLITPIFKIVTDTSVVESMSIIGIAFLLFIVGLEMDLKSLKNVALVAGAGGSIQICLLFIIGYFVSILLGYLPLEAVYVGLILAFSSTMVVMKLLSDKRELQTFYQRF